MMKKIIPILFPLFFIFININAQSSEGKIFETSSRLEVYLPSDQAAQLDGTERYVQLGFVGNDDDIEDMLIYIDRFTVRDKDLITKVGTGISEEMIDYYKFFLDPLFDANDFQTMMEMLGIKKFKHAGAEHAVTEFSNTVYAFIKSKNK